MIMANNNENKILNVPHLRFPEFTGEWESFKLTELGKFIGGGTPSSSNLSFWAGSIPWISSSDIKEDSINNISISRYITEEAIEKSTTKYCPAPVILIVSRVGVGKVALSYTSLCTSQDFCNIIEIKCHPVFLSYNLLRTMKRKSREVQGTSIKGITSDELQKIRVFIPQDKDEQNKISNILTLLDERIATQNKIIEDLKKLKSAIIDYIFNNEVLSFRKRIHLSDVATKITQKNTNNHVSNVLSNSANQGIIPQSEVFDREIANEDNTSNYFVISQNDFVYNPRKSATAPYGPINRYYGQTDGVISPLYLCFRSHNIDVEYLGWYFKSDSWHKFVYQNGDTGVRHDRVSIKDEIFFSMPLFIHNADEQIEIAKRLNKIESFVKQEEQYLFLLESQKLYLLQQMFI